MNKIRVCVVFGGRSAEYEVSCRSAVTVMNGIDKEKYNILLIGITKDGKWWLYEDDVSLIPTCEWINAEKKREVALVPDREKGYLLIFGNGSTERLDIDVFFPVIHGDDGEDGTIQGVFEMLRIPYAGCGVLSSAAAYDKLFTKLIVSTTDVAMADYIVIRSDDNISESDLTEKVGARFTYPVFVKPCRAGSSNGVSKVTEAGKLYAAVTEALKFDDCILIEEGIKGREVECAVLDTRSLKAARVGEVIAAADFYSYDAKYNNTASVTDVSPTLPTGIADRIKRDALTVFRILGCSGLSRVDFFFEEATGRVLFNEINTIPGFTQISMYPMLMNSEGISTEALTDALISDETDRTRD